LLLQVQGVIAEYERAKIIERVRRGRRHAARLGSLAALARWPTPRMVITTLAPRREPIRPAMRWCLTRRVSSASCSTGWDASGAPLGRWRGA
jgi:DNA invertase Pin-like site-specific DNA recombinase